MRKVKWDERKRRRMNKHHLAHYAIAAVLAVAIGFVAFAVHREGATVSVLEHHQPFGFAETR